MPRGSRPVVKCPYCQTLVAVPEAFRKGVDVAKWSMAAHDYFAANAYQWRAGVETSEFFNPLTQAFVDGCYRWDARRGPRLSTTIACMANSVVSDFHCSVSCRHTVGSNAGSSWGMVFRVQNVESYFVFRMADSQHFAVAAVEAGRWRSLADWTRSGLIKPGAVNQLSVLALDNHFDLSINGQRVYELDDERGRNSGYVGLAIEMYAAGEHAVYDFQEIALRTP